MKDQALHTHPYNLHFLNGCLKELCIQLNRGRPQLGWSPDRVKGMCSAHSKSTQPGFFKALSPDCKSEITMLQAVMDQSIEHQIVLWGFSYLSVPWSLSAHSVSWMDKIHHRYAPHGSRRGGLPCVTACDSSWLDQPVPVLHRGFYTAPLPSPGILLSFLYSEIVSGGPLPLLQLLNSPVTAFPLTQFLWPFFSPACNKDWSFQSWAHWHRPLVPH